MMLLVTGGAGFIGSNFVRRRALAGDRITVLDALTYAGHMENLSGITDSVTFVKGDICDAKVAGEVVTKDVDAVVNFAAESHVDRSIMGASEFIRTNVAGVQVLLDAVRESGCPRFIQVSTDEVYGSTPQGEFFDESTPLAPSNPYAASKAGADLLALSYFRTHNTPVMITRCTNNYGPWQYPEKLIPLFLLRAMKDEELPLYGDGLNERDWIHVDDHCSALDAALSRGEPGQVYNICQGSPVSNREIVARLLKALGKPESLIGHVADRPGHDRRYALRADKARQKLGWEPEVNIEDGIARTVEWYRSNVDWLQSVTDYRFAEHCTALYGDCGSE